MADTGNFGESPQVVDEDESSGAPDDASDDASDEAILKEAQARFALAEEAESEIRANALDDLEFRAGKQWPSQVEAERATDGRPCLVINRLPQFIQQLTNDQRQNRPAIKVHPVNNGADEETAKVIQGLIRHIEYNSNAEVAYDTAFESAVTGGFGYFRIVTDFVGPDSFDQEILIKRIRNPFSVYFDPYSQEPDGSDANWAILTDDLSADEYRATYPDSELASSGFDWSATGNAPNGWVKSDSVRIAEYFYKETKEKTIHQLATGEVVDDASLEARQLAAIPAGLDARVAKSRTVKVPIVKWCKLNGVEILEQTEWPGSFIPIIPVYGAELDINGKRILESIVRNAKDPQRMYNYWASAETEAIALAPKAPFVGAEGQFEGHEENWATANRKNHAYLEYKQTDSSGRAAPPPQRQSIEPAVQAITQARMMSADDLKSTTGVYDAQMGAQGNEVAGIAIQRRANQSQTSNFHFTDNLTRSMRHTGRILVDLLPHIYDTARAERIIGDDGTQKVVQINEEHTGDNGKPALYDLSVGRYDVTVDTGPSFASKRQEAAASMIEFTRAVPQIAGACADLIVKNMDWPGAQDFADRIKKTLPPQLQDDPKTKDIPPQMIAQMQHMGMMCDSLKKELDEATKVIETKKLELEHKERIEIWNLQAKSEIEMAKLGSSESVALLQTQMTEMEHRLKFLQINQPIEAANNFDPENADGGNYAGVGHIGGTENLTGGDTPGSPVEGNP